jgi:hypothetical protein
MKFLDDYQKREWLGRRALLELQKIHPNIFKFNIEFTSGKYEDYDAFFFIYDNENKFKKYVWVEIKVRDKIYPDYFLEKEKWSRLERQRKRLYIDKKDIIYIYINFCPNGTYMWDITNMEGTKWVKRMMNKSTSNNRQEKELKSVIGLSTSDCRYFEYTLNEVKLIRNFENKKVIEKIEKKLSNGEINAQLFSDKNI